MGFRGEQTGKNGVVYIYDATSVWNAAKQRSEQKRIYIGKKDPETGKLIPNKKYFEPKFPVELYLGMAEDVRNLINIGLLTNFPLYKFIFTRYNYI